MPKPTRELVVVAHFTAADGCADDLRAVLETAVEATRAEDGCLAYRLHESTEAPGAFVFYERWSSAGALDAHGETDHIARLRADGAPFIATSDVRTFRQIA